jgi:hypothetical protein
VQPLGPPQQQWVWGPVSVLVTAAAAAVTVAAVAVRRHWPPPLGQGNVMMVRLRGSPGLAAQG